jgi:hypothetical protein
VHVAQELSRHATHISSLFFRWAASSNSSSPTRLTCQQEKYHEARSLEQSALLVRTLLANSTCLTSSSEDALRERSHGARADGCSLLKGERLVKFQ